MASPHDVTRLLREWANGSQSALEALTPLVYAELRRLAQSYLQSEALGHTLQPTALVHEAFLRLLDRDAPDCQNRSQLYWVTGHLMRQILIDHARTRQAVKRGGHVVHISLEEDLVVSRERKPIFWLWTMRWKAWPRSTGASVRWWSYASLGASVEETAEVLKVSEKTVRRDWQFAQSLAPTRAERGEG